MRSFLFNKYDLDPRLVSRLSHFWILSIALMAISVMGYTAASSIFLAELGAEGIPYAYLVMGLTFIPIYLLFSNMIDKYHLPNLLILVLAISAFSIFLIKFAIGINNFFVYFIVYIFFFMLWVLLVDIILPSLFLRFFTVIELKKAATLNTIAVSIGGMLGGWLASIFSLFTSLENLMIIPSALCLATILVVLHLNNRERPLQTTASHKTAKTGETLKSMPKLIKSYPIVAFIMASVFLFILINCIGEYLAYTIYEKSFPDSNQLASFLGLVLGGQCILQIVVIYFFTGPMLNKTGVARMNLIFPITTLASFVLLRLWFILPSAIITHMNYDALYQGVDKPVFSLNYSALPNKYVGMIHVLSDGVFYCFALLVSGLLLIAAEYILDIDQIIVLGIIASSLFVVVRLMIGRSYLSGLMSILKSNKIDFDKTSDNAGGLSPRYEPDVIKLLKDSDIEKRLLGVELAIRMKNANAFTDLIRNILAKETAKARTVEILSSYPNEQLAKLYSDFQIEPKHSRSATLINIQAQKSLPDLVEDMSSRINSVRIITSRLIVKNGKKGIEQAYLKLDSNDWYEQETAILVLCHRNRWIDEYRLINSQKQHTEIITKCVETLALLPDDEKLLYLRISIQDYLRRIFDRFLKISEILSGNQTVNVAKIMLNSSDPRTRSSATEALLSLGKDNFILPIKALLETWNGNAFEIQKGSDKPKLSTLIRNMAEVPDFWIRTGARLSADQLSIELQSNCKHKKDTEQEFPMDALYAMKKSPILSGLSFDELVAVYATLEETQYNSGEIVCKQGELDQTMFLLLNGTVEVSRAEDGEEKYLASIDPGEFFGEMSIIDNEPRAATIKAKTDIIALKWTADQFTNATNDFPQILRAVCKILSQRLRKADKSLSLV